MTRPQMLEQLAQLIVAVKLPHPVRVAIDGVDAAGKTTLANDLVRPIENLGKPVIRASIDGFHHPKAKRYKRGEDSPEGYFYDSFNYETIRRVLLVPLGPDGDRQYSCAVFDYRTDSQVQEPVRNAVVNSVLLFDGVFLLRPELNDYWDYRIFVQVDSSTAVRRACHRDQLLFGSSTATRLRYLKRYVPGQKLYLQNVHPHKQADVVVENNDPANPILVVGNQDS